MAVRATRDHGIHAMETANPDRAKHHRGKRIEVKDDTRCRRKPRRR